MDRLLFGAADGPPNQESLTIGGGGKLVLANRRGDPSGKQRAGSAGLAGIAAGHIHAHQPDLGIEKEQLATNATDYMTTRKAAPYPPASFHRVAISLRVFSRICG